MSDALQAIDLASANTALDSVVSSLESFFGETAEPAEPPGKSTSASTVDPDLHHLVISENSNVKRSWGWSAKKISLTAFEHDLCTYSEVARKFDAGVFVPGEIEGDERRAAAVSALLALVLDLDKGDDLDLIRRAVQSKGLLALVYSTFSHMTTTTEIKIDDYRKFVGEPKPTPEGLRRYLEQEKGIDPKFLEFVAVHVDYRDTADGAVCVASHAPIPKYRIVFPLEKPFARRDCILNGKTQKEFEAAWKAKYAAVANSLGVRWDATCADVTRAFFYPSCRHGAPRFAEKIDGKLLNIDDIQVEPAAPQSKADTPPTNRASAPHQTARKPAADHRLTAWIARYGAKFEIETALRSRAPSDIFRDARPGKPGVHIACPFEDTHTDAGGTGTFVVNASENDEGNFAIHCCHEHCLKDRGSGTSVDRLIFIEEMLERGWLVLDDLENLTFGGGPIQSGPNRDRAHQARRDDLCVIDRDGRGLDAAVFHANVIARDGLDLVKLNKLGRTQIASDVTAEQIAQFVESGQISVANLLESFRDTGGSDPYDDQLRDLAVKKTSENLSNHRVDVVLGDIGKTFKVKQKTIVKDFANAEREVKARLATIGLLSAEQTSLIPPLRDYADRFAIVMTGGKALVFNLNEPNLSQALMPASDFELAYRKEWIDVTDANGGTKTIYPAAEFLKKPPKHTRVYHGGFVFRPSGTVPPDQFNLYRGIQIDPDPSGSCSLFHDLIGEVWTPNDPVAAEWVIEWLMHMVAHPGVRVGTCIAIRGAPGDGKSIVFEALMSTILGDTLLRVTNHNMILGDFNEALLGKVATVLEEAAFAGDKRAFDRMKELITGKRVAINQKFKALIEVDNYSRMVVISNHEHFLHIEPDDRRYTVLESSSAWKGTDKFEKLLDQWRNGGAARFVYEALNHSFRRIAGRDQLVIDTNLKTTAGMRQVALSRSPLEQCLVNVVLTGRLDDAGSAWPTCEKWELDKPLEIESLRLDALVRSRIGASGRGSLALHTITTTLANLIGETQTTRPKAPGRGGGRQQLPTVRRLPPRRDAIKHARAKGLITDEEFEAAIPATDEENGCKGANLEGFFKAVPDGTTVQ